MNHLFLQPEKSPFFEKFPIVRFFKTALILFQSEEI